MEKIFTSSEVLRAVDITYRQLSYWELKGIIKPTFQKQGTRNFKRYTQKEIDTLQTIKKLLDEGYNLPTADTLKEIAKRKQLEEKLIESEERYKTLFESAAEGILIIEIQTKEFKYANPAISRMLGYTVEELKGMSICDIHPKDELKYVISQFEAQVKGEKTLALDIPCLRKDGTVIYVNVNGAVALIDGAECMTGFFTDITECKKVEEEIKSLAKFPSENPNPVLRITKDGKVLYSNDAGKLLLVKWSCKVGEAVPGKWRSIIAGAFKFGKDRQEEEEEEEEEVRGRNFSLTITPIKNYDYANLYARDITEYKKTEKKQTLRFEILKTLHQQKPLKNVCESVVSLMKEYLKCDVVALRLKEGDDYPYFVNNGFSEAFIESENYLCVRNKKGETIKDSKGCPIIACMCGTIVTAKFNKDKPFFTREGSFWTESTTDLLAFTTGKDRGTTTRNLCNDYGYESVALVPVKTTGDNAGLLQVNDKRRNFFSLDDICFLEELGHIIGMVVEGNKAEGETIACN